MLPEDALISLRVLLALVFLSAGAGKLRHREVLEGVIANYRVLPRALVPLLSHTLAPVELLIGIALLVPAAATPVAEIAAALLLGVFALAMGINLRRGRSHIDCGCFRGTLRQTLRWELVLRNLALMGVALVCAGLPLPAPGGAQLLNGVLGGVGLFVLLQGMNTLWAIDTGALLARGRPAWASRSAS
jgi:uncharacterized membrane protein